LCPLNYKLKDIGNVEFLAGRYGLDSEINGFWIPVKVSI